MPLYIDIHILQTVPPSNLNRDQTGNPKTATYGGVLRARVSSQAWKRATRTAYKDHFDPSDLGVRTKRAVELLCERMHELDESVTPDEARAKAAAVFTALGIQLESVKSKRATKAEAAGELGEDYDTSKYLIFWSNRQLDRLAMLAMSSEKPTKKEAAEAADREHGIDVALFGRMVADDGDFNVDASVQVAHALSTHAVEIEQDYFTAVDEGNPSRETGAAMIDTLDFDSATLYRYATINVAGLHANLAGDGEATVRAIEAFVSAFVTSMPTGKQNTFANRTTADCVIVAIRTDQPLNLVGAFEEAIESEAAHVRPSVEALVRHYEGVVGMVGPADLLLVARSSDRAAAVDALATPQPLNALVSALGADVRGRIASS